MTYRELVDEFLTIYGGDEEGIRVFDSPGRVNLIGEHTDYNGGYVFPAALTLSNAVAVRPNGKNVLRLAVSSLPDRVTADIDNLTAYRELPWGNYQIGVAYTLQQAGVAIIGCDMYYNGTVPYGSGLSSSAAIEVVTVLALLGLAGVSMSVEEVAKIAQKAENEYVGVQCGIMDQFASAAGQADCALLLDCDSLEYEVVPLHLGENHLLIINTNKTHKLDDSKYNDRRRECEEALAILRGRFPELTALCKMSMEKFEANLDLLPDETLMRRARHAVSENARTLEAVRRLKADDIEGFGKLMNASHESLRDDYEVTGKELDCLYDLGRNFPGVLGIRMTGGGFGGCAVAVVEASQLEAAKAHIGEGYRQRIGYDATFYSCGVGNGGREIVDWREKADTEQGFG